jgi:hypothetical protein
MTDPYSSVSLDPVGLELLEAAEHMHRLLCELRRSMTLQNLTQWAHLEENHNRLVKAASAYRKLKEGPL